MVAVAVLGGLLSASSAVLPARPAAADSPSPQTTLGFHGLQYIYGVAVDGAGDVFVTDAILQNVVELTAAGTQINLGFTGLVDPAGVAVDGAGDVLVVDRNLSRVVELSKNGAQTTLPFTGLMYPSGVAVDRSGDILVADSGNGRVVQLATNGAQTTLAFTGLKSPTGVAVDSAGDVFVADSDRADELPHDGAQITLPIGGMGYVSGIAADAAGDVFAASGTRVVELPRYGVATTLAFNVVGAVAVALDRAGSVLVADFTARRVVELPPSSLQQTPIALDIRGVALPAGVAVDASGDVFLADTYTTTGQGSQKVVELPVGGPQITLPFSVGALSGLTGLAVDGTGNVFVADAYNGVVLEMSSGGTQTTFLSGLNGPTGIAADNAGDVFVAVSGDNTVLEVPKGGVPKTLGFTGLNVPFGVAVDGAGDVFVADRNSNRVVELAAGGTQVTLGFSGLSNPTGVAVDGSGNVFVVNAGDYRVLELPNGGTQIEVGLTAPTTAWVAVDGTGAVYETNLARRSVDVLAAAPTVTVTVAGSQPFGGAATFARVDNAPAAMALSGSLSCGTVNHGAAIGPSLSPNGGPYAIDPSSCSGLSLSGPGASSYAISYRGGSFNVDQAAIAWADPAPLVYGTALSAGQLGATATVPGTFVYSPAPGTVLHTKSRQPLTATFTPTDTTRFARVTTTVFVSVAEASLIVTANNVTWPVAQPRPTLTASFSGFSNGDSPVALRGSLQFATMADGSAPGDFPITPFGLLSTDYALLFVKGVLTVAADRAIFKYPVDHEDQVDTTRPFQWSTYPGAQAYYLIIGTSKYGFDIVNSGPLPPSQTLYTVPDLPPGFTYSATLFTQVGGSWARIQTVTFVPAPGHAMFLNPVNGQGNVTPATPFTWLTVQGAQAYYLVVGTTVYGYDLVNSGALPPTQSSFKIPPLPTGVVLYATIITESAGAWSRNEVVGFVAAS